MNEAEQRRLNALAWNDQMQAHRRDLPSAKERVAMNLSNALIAHGVAAVVLTFFLFTLTLTLVALIAQTWNLVLTFSVLTLMLGVAGRESVLWANRCLGRAEALMPEARQNDRNFNL